MIRWRGAHVDQPIGTTCGRPSRTEAQRTALIQLPVIGGSPPVITYLPAFNLGDEDRSNSITIRQLLNQTSGIPTSVEERPFRCFATHLRAASPSSPVERGRRKDFVAGEGAVVKLVLTSGFV